MDKLGMVNEEEMKMLGWIAELLPLFFVRWVALRHCERLRLAGSVDVVMARPDVLVRVPPKLRDMTEDDFNAAHGMDA